MKYVIRPKAIPERIFKDLDEEQRNAVVNSRGRSIVIAGPGSGKTRVITYKLAYLISQGVPPSEILLVTFTRAAAREMIERAKSVTGRDLSNLIAGTFHSVCNAFLRRYAKLLGYESNYTILDREDAKDLMRHARSTVAERLPSDISRLIPREGVLLSIHSYMMNTLSSLEEAIKEKNPVLLQSADLIEEVFKEYELQKVSQNVMDYDDLLVNFLRLLREDERISESLSSRFRWILVDEFQDTNIVQYLIVEELSRVHGNVFVVGDDAQSIYSFRGARFENVEDFMKVEGTMVFKIQTNYRSTERIVDLVNAMIPRSAVRKELRAVRRGGKKPVVVETLDDEEQSLFVAQRIEELMEEGVQPDEIAVLYRAHGHSMRLQMVLTTRSIPFRILSGQRFTETAHVKDVLAFLKVVQNPLDLVSWVRISKLFEGIGDATASRIARSAVEGVKGGRDFLDSIPAVKGKARKGIEELKMVLSEIRNLENPGDMIRKLLDAFYSEHLDFTYENARERKEDIETLASIADRYDSLERFLSDITTAEDVGPYERSEGGKVTLSTVHQAKGLEWKVVFVISVNPGDFPNWMAMREGKIDEEERLFYVAITRAKDELYIVHQTLGTGRPFVGNRIRWMRGRGFVDEIPDHLVERWEVE